MLKELFIKNFLLIDQSNLSFKDGFNVITGETGSGKSLLIKAISSLSGSSLPQDILKDSSQVGVVVGTFSLSSSILSFLKERGFEIQEEDLIIRRSIFPSGASSFFLNDQKVSLSLIKELGDLLIERHGQHASQILLKNSSYLHLLDTYACLEEDLKVFSESYKEFLLKKEAYESWLKDLQENKENQDHYRKILKEIREVNPLIGEEETLIRSLKENEGVEDLEETLKQVQEGFFGDSNGGIINSLVKMKNLVEVMGRRDPFMKDLSSRFHNIYYEMEDIAETYKQALFNLNYSPLERESQQARLFELTKLQKKLKKSSSQEILGYKQEIENLLEDLENLEEEQRGRKEKLTADYKVLLEKASFISEVRKSNLKPLEESVNSILKELDMKGVEFKASQEPRKTLSDKGIDKIIFSLSQGGKIKPLSEVASGGELSRIMLALKTLIFQSASPSCLIFDEIDTGLGGKAGSFLGEYISKIALRTQVFVITHLATVASFAQENIFVYKESQNQEVLSYIKILSKEEDRVKEISRMMSGNISEPSLAHAQELFLSSQRLGRVLK